MVSKAMEKTGLSTRSLIAVCVFVLHVAAGQDLGVPTSFWRFVNTNRFTFSTRSPPRTRPSFRLPTTTPERQFIVIGNPADEGEYPFMVFMDLENVADKRKTQCGGSLLNNEWVLTAAHCLDGLSPTKILIGAHQNDGSDPNAVTRTMARKCCHKDYDSTTLANDICLVKLSSPVTYGTYIKKVTLPPPNSITPDGTVCTVMGWGLNEEFKLLTELQEADVKVINKNQCQTWYNEIPRQLPTHHFCAGHVEGGADTCGGDSGGPLVIKEGGKFVLRGITSFGPEVCGSAERPGVYTRVSSYISWINRKMSRPCKDHTWGPWAATCGVTCGTGTETSIRRCRDEDGAVVSPSKCPGSATKQGTCTRDPCTVQANWGPWTTKCSVTCGEGQETKTRECFDGDRKSVPPAFCSPGSAVEFGTCTNPPCSVYRWGPWTDTCSVICGEGINTRTRKCLDQNDTPVPGPLCGSGESTEQGKCFRRPCTVYEWGPWKKTCSVTCGSGVETRNRQCLDQDNNPAPDDSCDAGKSEAKGTCHKQPCQVFRWGPWSESCSVTCGNGVETRSRQCLDQDDNPAANSLCGSGKDEEKGTCSRPPCQVYRWSSWKKICSVTCGNGVETRTRQCMDSDNRPAPDPLCSPGMSEEKGTCYRQPCKVVQDYYWEPWNTQCSVTCGSGIEQKFRRCLDSDGIEVNVHLCSAGPQFETGTCSLPSCKSGFKWGPWKSTCTVTCGSGTELRTRECFNDNGDRVDPGSCVGQPFETKICNKPTCPSSGPYQWSAWHSWSSCRVSTGSANTCDGFKSATRDCLHMGRDVNPFRCISTIGGDYYKETSCRPRGC